MVQASEFGVFLKQKRQEAQLTQDELASAIGKTGQYISNIEKGKNNSPPKEADIEALIQQLDLDSEDTRKFRVKAAADRQQLPKSQMQYILSHPSLCNCFTMQKNTGLMIVLGIVFSATFQKESKMNLLCSESAANVISPANH